MKILLDAPILTQSGYGEHSRLVFNSIKDTGHEIYINPLEWGSTSWDVDGADEDVKNSIIRFGEYIDRATEESPASFDMQIHVGIPNEFEKRAPYSVCVTAGIETDKVSSNWLLKTHQGIDKMIVPSEHAKSGFLTTSYSIKDEQREIETILECNCPISVVPYPVKVFDNNDPISLDGVTTEFNFLSIALWGPRKNLTNMINWFLEEFKNDENVGLILKTGMSRGSVIDREQTTRTVKNITDKHPESKCKVYIIHGNMTEEEIHSLYLNPKIKAYVTTSHGEGYGLPVFEAAYSGLPIVATDWSGHLDFLSGVIKEKNKLKIKKLFARVDFKLREVPKSAWWDHIIVQDSRWAYPEARSFKKQIRNVYKNLGLYRKWAKALKEKVLEDYSSDAVHEMMKNELLSFLDDANLNFQSSSTDEENGDLIVL